MPFSRLTSGIVLCFYDNCSCGFFRSMLTPPISRLYDYGIQIHLRNQQQEAMNFEPVLCFFQCLVKVWTLFCPILRSQLLKARSCLYTPKSGWWSAITTALSPQSILRLCDFRGGHCSFLRIICPSPPAKRNAT